MKTIECNIKRDNCKNCVSNCEHAGKDREFVIMGKESCKVTGTKKHYFYAAVQYEIDGKELAFVLRIPYNENIVSLVKRNNYHTIQLCDSEKSAGKLASMWNDMLRAKGICAV